MSSRSFLPGLLVGAGALLCFGMFSFAALLIQEEEEERRMLEAAAAAIPHTLFQQQSKRGVSMDGNQTAKRRLIFWDCERTNAAIDQDYLGASPAFSLDDFKRIFRVS
jgi:hypothetical protein